MTFTEIAEEAADEIDLYQTRYSRQRVLEVITVAMDAVRDVEVGYPVVATRAVRAYESGDDSGPRHR
jgi:hypothetical protein